MVSRLRWRLKLNAAAASASMFLTFIAERLDGGQRCRAPGGEQRGKNRDDCERAKSHAGSGAADGQPGKHIGHFYELEGTRKPERNRPSNEPADERDHAALGQK